MSERICIKCRHHSQSLLGVRCQRDRRSEADPVLGETIVGGNRDCNFERMDAGIFDRLFGSARCGRTGRFFEAGEPDAAR